MGNKMWGRKRKRRRGGKGRRKDSVRKNAYESPYCVSGISYSFSRYCMNGFMEIKVICPLSILRCLRFFFLIPQLWAIASLPPH